MLVEEEPEEAVLAVELDDVPRELVRLVDLGRPRRDALARELTDQLAELSLLVGQRVERHVLGYSGLWQTASMLLPSASCTYAP